MNGLFSGRDIMYPDLTDCLGGTPNEGVRMWDRCIRICGRMDEHVDNGFYTGYASMVNPFIPFTHLLRQFTRVSIHPFFHSPIHPYISP